MREILFRGKRIDNGEWVEGDYILLNDNDKQRFNYRLQHIKLRNHVNRYAVIPETIGQYTGLKDKNGKRIFEGDILKCRHEWTGKNDHSQTLDSLFAIGLYTYEEMQEDFESQRIKAAYGKHAETDAEAKRFFYYRNYVVEYYHPKGCYRVRNGSVFYDMTNNFIFNRKAEVIGNIHDNPELLEEEHER